MRFSTTTLLALPFVLVLPSGSYSQSVVASTSYSLSSGLIGGRIGTTASVPIVISVTVAAAASSATTAAAAAGSGSSGAGSASASGGNLITIGASSTTGGGILITQGATSTTQTTTLPPAPGATIDPNSVAPVPGSTINGIKIGPDDNYIAGARGALQGSVAIAAAVAAVCFGAVHLL